MRDLKLNIQNMLVQASYYSAFCGSMIYSVKYLNSHGLPPEYIGMLYALGYLSAIWVQHVASGLADREDGLSIRAIALLHVLIPAAAIAPLLLTDTGAGYRAFAFFICCAFQIAGQSIFNAIGVAYESAGYHLLFGVIRGMGSLGFTVTSLVLGYYFNTHAIDGLVPAILIALLACAFCLLLLPEIPKGGRAIETVSDTAPGSFYKRYPAFIPLLIGVPFLFLGHAMINNYMSFIMESAGGSSSQLGIAIAIASVAEVVPMFTYHLMRRQIDDRIWVIIAVAAFTGKMALLCFARTPTAIYISQALQMLAFGIYTPAFSYFANRAVERRDMVKGQAMTVTVMILGGIFGNLLGGMLIGRLGVSMMLLIGSVLSAAGSMIAILGLLRFRIPAMTAAKQGNQRV